LQRHGPPGGRSILAGERDPLSGAHLVLQAEQVELIGLQLRKQPLADEHPANAGIR
jgi:hypothetical protein